MASPRFAGLALSLSILLACSDGSGPQMTPAPVTAIAVSPHMRALAAGDTLTFAATPVDASGKLVSNVIITWSSSDTMIAVMTGARVTARRTGSVTITA